jgi:hypothetical protein
MKSPLDAAELLHFFMLRLARLVLNWSLHLYSELYHEITTRCSRVVALLQGRLAGKDLAWSLRLY